MPLAVLGAGEKAIVKRVGGDRETRYHLADLGFCTDTLLSVIQSQDGNMIVNIKGTKLAITKEMASKIMVGGVAQIK